MLLLIIVLLILFSGGGYWGYRRNYYGGSGLGLIGVLLLVLLVGSLVGGPHLGWYHY